MSGKHTTLLATCFIVALTSFASAEEDCEGFLNEAEAVDGLVPLYNEDGSFRGIKAYGEATFLVPKRSLINTARKKAVLSADRNFADWRENFISGSTNISGGEIQSEITNEAGETEGTVEERQQFVNVISSYTPETIQKGMVTLDECVNTKEKYVIVERGWKPEYVDVADEASSAMERSGQSAMESSRQNDLQNRSEGKSTLEGEKKLRSEITPSQGYRKKSSLKDDF